MTTGGTNRRIDWDALPLGETSDYEIARQMSVNPTTVRRARIRRGINKCDDPRGTGWEYVDFNSLTNREISDTLGVTVSAVSYQRRKAHG